jgi:uncharacterized RDD family membrane protein YckC
MAETTQTEIPWGAAAPLPRRAGAFVVDWLLCVLLSTPFGDPRVTGWPPVAILLFTLTLFIGLFGQTPGMAMTKIRCVAVADGGAIGIPRAFIRAILTMLIIPAVVLDAFGRGLHDHAANSVMVLVPPRSTD